MSSGNLQQNDPLGDNPSRSEAGDGVRRVLIIGPPGAGEVMADRRA